MSGVLTDVQGEALAILRSDLYYAQIALLSEQLGEIRNEIQRALAKLGLCAIVLTPEATFQHTQAPGPILDPLSLTVEIVEFVTKNRGASGTQIPASDAAEHTAWLLHFPNHAHHRSDAHTFTARRIRMVPDKQFLVYRVEFTTSGVLAGIIEEE